MIEVSQPKFSKPGFQPGVGWGALLYAGFFPVKYWAALVVSTS
jgi:hypothetical protein